MHIFYRILKSINSLISRSSKNIVEFLKDQNFSKAILMTISLVVPIILTIKMDALQIGINITLGAILVSPSDVFGSVRLKIKGMFLSTLLGMIVTFIGFYLQVSLWVLIPALGLIVFGIAYLSIYGFRASLISFSGLFALVLSFSSLSHSALSVYERIMWIGVGGLWYILLTLLRHLIFPKAPTEFYLSETLKVTAEYLETRANLIDPKSKGKGLQKKLLELQTQLTENHETLRELLIVNRKSFGKSNYQSKRLLIFVQLVDILELAMANPVNYSKIHKIFKENPEQLKVFKEVLSALSSHLKHISKNISRPHKITGYSTIAILLEKIKKDIKPYSKEKERKDKDRDLILKNYWKYINNQFNKIEKIQLLLDSRTQLKTNPKKEDFLRFLTKQDFNLKIFKGNFNKRSTIFRHSVRIALVAMIGYALGYVFNIENAYWILLTVIVIMRPNFGLTKTRFKQRTTGTLIGGALAFVIVYFIRDTTVYAVLSIICFVIGFSMIQRNYKAAASFITLYVLFIYALLRPNVFDVIQFRVIDTLIGAGLAFGANLLLWPSWEVKSIDKTVLEAIRNNRLYLEEIGQFYNAKGEPTSEYKLTRKSAFLAMSDLSSSFQRMTQEPKTKQKNIGQIYRIVMLNHRFISALASLGTYVMHNPTTPASENFNAVIDRIKENLHKAENNLTAQQFSKSFEDEEDRTALQAFYEKDMKKIGENPTLENDLDFQFITEETQLVVEQLKWLWSISKKLSKISKV